MKETEVPEAQPQSPPKEMEGIHHKGKRATTISRATALSLLWVWTTSPQRAIAASGVPNCDLMMHRKYFITFIIIRVVFVVVATVVIVITYQYHYYLRHYRFQHCSFLWLLLSSLLSVSLPSLLLPFSFCYRNVAHALYSFITTISITYHYYHDLWRYHNISVLLFFSLFSFFIFSRIFSLLASFLSFSLQLHPKANADFTNKKPLSAQQHKTQGLSCMSLAETANCN